MKRLLLSTLACTLLLSLAPVAATAQQPAALAPILVEPYNGRDVTDEQIIWSWFMQSRASNGEEILCDLVVVEILEGQTAEEAMRLNPPVIIRENLTTSSWGTSPFARSLGHGRRYTWQITAKVRRADGFRILSRSELWELTYNDPAVVAGEIGGAESSGAGDLPSTTPPEGRDSTGVTLNDTLLPTGLGIAPPVGGEGVTEDEAPAPPRPIEISGAARHLFSSENRRGNLSGTPARFDRVQIEPTVKLFGVPLDLSFLVSTEGAARSGDLSRGAFGSDDVRRGLKLAVAQRLDQQVATLEQSRDSASADSARAFAALDSTGVAERIAQIEELREQIEEDPSLQALAESNLLTPEQATLAQFPSFGFGKVAPSFGALLFDRVTVNGGVLEYNPGLLYVAGAVGKLQRSVDPSALSGSTADGSDQGFETGAGALEFFRNVYSARLGIGRREGSYAAITGFYAEDDEAGRALASILNRPTVRAVERLDSNGLVEGIDTILVENRAVGHQRNYGFGGVGRFEEREWGLTLDGEFNLMYFDDSFDRPAQSRIPLPQALPDFLKSDSALTDFNFAVRADWRMPEWGGMTGGRLTGGVRYVGGGYRSVGTADLRADIMRGDVRYRTTALDRQLRFDASYSREEAGYKDSSNSSLIDAVAAAVDLRLRRLPALSLRYTRHDQRLETGKRDTLAHSRTRNTIDHLSATVAWLRRWGDVRWSLFGSGSLQLGTSEGEGPGFSADSVGVFRTSTLQLDNRVALGPLVTVGALAAWTKTETHPTEQIIDTTGDVRLERGAEKQQNYTLDLSVLLQPLDVWSITLGGVATYQDEIPQPIVLGGYIGSRLTLGAFGTIELRFDYRETAQPDLQSTFPVERIGRIVTSVTF